MSWQMSLSRIYVAFGCCTMVATLFLTAPPGWAQATSPSPQQTTDIVYRALAAFNKGCALLEQYEYSAASKQFEAVLKEFPQWTAAKFNLGLAYLNMMEDAGGKEIINQAEQLFQEVARENPQLIHAWYCLGLYYEHVGQREKALEVFQKAYQLDPQDPHICLKLAEAYLAMQQNEKAIELLERAVNLDPGFVSAIYRLALQYQRLGKRDAASKLFERFRALNQAEVAGGSFTVRKIYGSAGKYYYALGPDMLPIVRQLDTDARAATPVFDPESRELVKMGPPWRAGQISIEIGGVAVADLNKDGILDLVLSGVTNDHATQVLFGEKNEHFQPGEILATQAICAAVGDVDNDGDVDIWIGGAGFVRLMENDGTGHFKPFSGTAASMTGDFTALHVRLLDIDSDGDLDLYASRFNSNGEALAPLLLINNRDGTFEEKAAAWGLETPQFSAVATSWLDIDNDRDLDLILASGKGSPVIWLNDRAGAFRIVKGSDAGLDVPGVSGLTTGDVNCDGRPDLVVLSSGRVRLFLNQGACRFREDEAFARQFGKLGGTIAQLADIDNDGDADLFIADSYLPNGARQPVILLNSWPKPGFVNLCQEDPRFLFCGVRNQGNTAGVLADFDGDGGLDVLIAPLSTSSVWFRNCASRGNWLSLDLAGTRYTDQKSRSNESAIGARVEVRSGQIFQQWDVGQIAGSTCWAPLRLHFGLGHQQEVEWLRIIWPDAVLQSEVSIKANQVASIGEVPRKTSSCPHLFVWNGDRFEFVSDFGGKGGLGYLIRPGIYAQPYPVEFVPLPRIKHNNDPIVCKIIEPLEEVVYFDHASLIAVDHPAGTFVLPNEMMPVSVTDIPEEILCFGEELDPIAATNDRGQDVLTLLKRIDRDFVGPTEQDKRFVGYAKEHSLVLQFPDSLDRWLESGRRIFFIGHGWVEYSYSQTNFAAAQAGLTLRAPTFEVFRDGKWIELIREAGYPAGVNHWMTLELTHFLQKGDRKLRIKTNMDLYWDRIFLAATIDGAIQQSEIYPRLANLTYRGFPREYSPDGKQPTLLDYESIDLTLPWKSMPGFYTRFGDVTELVMKRDDAFVIMGPGEELTLQFDVGQLPEPPAGYVRSWILKTDSFCKDMDIHTAEGDQVEPLPFHTMRSYPYSLPEKFPETPATIRARTIYNIRWMGSRNNGPSNSISKSER